ncbi:MAG: hypothetical protein IEMM0008_1025 [bacterium]|nr:MAG: hypothetical protein IEMM0008_1025 [bacterium]
MKVLEDTHEVILTLKEYDTLIQKIRSLEKRVQSENRTSRPIWDKISDIMKDLPESELDKLPPDGAEQHDHYIYGIPKREI